MDKRSFLKKSAILGVGGSLAASLPGTSKAAGMILQGNHGKKGFVQPKLGYSYDALEPNIDAMTMEVHYSKHHAGYTKKFNTAVNESGLTDLSVKKIFSKVSQYSDGVRNNGGGFYNHNLFWKSMSPKGGGEPEGDLLKALEKDFGSYEKFREVFSIAAASRFGSGWAWLIKTPEGGLKVTSTPNQDNPLMDIAKVKGKPLLTIDVWEHAYYLKYQNRRTDYISAFWNIVDWDRVADRYNK